MWLFSSSIGRKFVMAVTGLCLVLFVTFHVVMNSVALLWPTAYNAVCEFLGANWYALIASMGLAALFVIHILYALWLTLQNRRARGNDRYAVTSRPAQVEWSSKNMLVLGIVVVAFLGLHLWQFWSKMQLAELVTIKGVTTASVADAPVGPAQGTLFLQLAFDNIWAPICYLVAFAALWLHMTHGFWSMFHTAGWDNTRWLPRLKCIANWWTSIVVALFAFQVVLFAYQAHNKFFIENEELQAQYAETWNEKAKALCEDFSAKITSAVAPQMAILQNPDATMEERMDANSKAQEAQGKFVQENGQTFLDKAESIKKAYEAQCSKIGGSEEIMQLDNFMRQVRSMLPANQIMVQPQQ